MFKGEFHCLQGYFRKHAKKEAKNYFSYGYWEMFSVLFS